MGKVSQDFGEGLYGKQPQKVPLPPSAKAHALELAWELAV